MTIPETEFSNNNIASSDSGSMNTTNDVDVSKDSFTTKSKRRIRFNSFSNSFSKKDGKSHQNSILFKNYFGDSFEDENDETEKEINTKTEDNITPRESRESLIQKTDRSNVFNLSQDKILFNNLQYDSMFIREIDPFKEKSIVLKNQNSQFNGNILDELKEEEKKEEEKKENENKNNDNDKYFDEKPPSYNSTFKKGKKSKRNSVRFNEEEINNHKKSSKSKKGKKNAKKNKGNDTTRELLKNKFLKFVKKYASNSKNYSLSDDVEIEKSFYNFYDENFGEKGVDFDASICTYEKNDGSKFNVTVNDLFDDRGEFDEFKNSIFIENDDSSSESTVKEYKKNTSFQYNSSFVYDHDSFGPDYEDTMNYLCYNISTCIDDEYIINDEEENRKMNENILSGLFDEEEEKDNDNKNKDIVKKEESKYLTVTNKTKVSENSKLKENLKTFMESEAFKKVINNPDTFIIFLKSILMGYVDPKKIDKAKDKLFNMIDNNEIEQIKKFVTNYVDIVEESEDKIKDMREKSIMIEREQGHDTTPCSDVVEQSPGFIAKFNEIMIEKFTNINNAIINFTTALCPQIIKNGFNNIMKSIPFVVSFASLIPMEYVTGLLSSFPAGQAILNAVNDVIMRSSLLASSHIALPQIAILIGCLYKCFTRYNQDNSRGINEDNSNTYLTKFMGLFEIFSKHLRSDGGLNNTEKDPSAITSKVVNALLKTMVESKDLPQMFNNDKVNSIVTNLMESLPNTDNKLKACLAVLNDVMNKDNATSKALFEELINLLDREKLSDEDFTKILTLIIKGSQNLQIMSGQNQNNLYKNSTNVATSSSTPVNEGDVVAMDLDKSYSVIMFSQVLDELKKSTGETTSNQENKNNLILSTRDINYKYPEDYKMNSDSLNSKIKMKKAYEKRSYSLVDKRNIYEKDSYTEFSSKNYNRKGDSTGFSNKKDESPDDLKQVISKYYPSPSASPTTSVSTSHVYFQRKNKSYDERRLNRGFSNNEIH
jgi:hypothetical protein